MESQIRQICAKALGKEVHDLDATRSFLALGGDSLRAVRVMAACEEIGIPIGIAEILSSSSISQLWNETMRARTGPSINSKMQLTAAQRLHLRMRALLVTTVAVGKNLSPYDSYIAMTTIVKRHPILRTQLPHAEDLAYSFTSDTENALLFLVRPLSKPGSIRADLCELTDGLGVTKGPIFGGMLFTSDHEPSELVLACHRAFMDFSSWHTIVGDLRKTLLGDGRANDVHAIQNGSHEEQASDLKAALGRRTLLGELDQLKPDMLDEHSEAALLTIDSDMTARLLHGTCHAILRTNASDILHSAVLLAMSSATAHDQAPIDIYIMQDAGLTFDPPKIGCHDTLWHLEGDISGELDGVQVLRNIKDATRGYSVKTRDMHSVISVAGQSDYAQRAGGWTIVVDTCGIPQEQPWDLSSKRQAMVYQHAQDFSAQKCLYMSTQFDNGCISCIFSTNDKGHGLLNRGTFANRVRNGLQKLLSSLKPGHAIPTFSDLGLADMSYPELEMLVERDLSQVASRPIEDIEKVIPCSHMQQDLLTSQQVDPRKYQCAFTLKFSTPKPGSVNAWRLASSWKEVVHRHATLRTVFVNGLPRQDGFAGIVLKKAIPEVHIYEGQQHLTSSPFSSQQVQPFEPSKPQHRLFLIQSTPEEVYLRLDISHALMDGQSAEVILRDLYLAYYQEPYTDKILRYEDFVSYENRLRTDLTSTYWSDYLRGADPTNIPAGAPDLQNAASFRFRFGLDKVSVTNLCAAHNVTLSSICHLAWALVLRVVSGSESVLFSYVTSGRDAPLRGIRHTIGAFVKSLVCRVEFSKAAKVGELLQKVVADFLQSLPFQHLEMAGTGVGVTNSARKWGNTTISFQRKMMAAEFASRDVRVDIEEVVNPVDYDIRVNVEADDEGLDIDIGYWAESMKDDVTVMGKLFETGVLQIVEGIDKSISDLVMLNTKDTAQIRLWNATLPTALRCCIHDMVRERCESQPEDAVAVCAWDGELTYRALWKQAQQVAHYLVNHVGPEVKVGLCMDKSRWAVVSMLAILLAGGVVVPLGTQHPRARVEGIVEDTGMKVILVDQIQARRLAGLAPHLITLSDSWLATLPAIIAATTAAPCMTVTPENAAWIIYTSGSTGTPKGVVLEHAALSTSLQIQGQRYGTGPQTRVLQFAAFTFDVSISDVFVTLIYGGCVCIISEDDRMNRLAEAMREFEVNFGNLTPTVVQLITPDLVPSLQTLLIGGEPLQAAIVDAWAHHATILNSYGVSECSIHSACSRPITNPKDVSTIGFPIAGNCWVADPTDYHLLSPVGVVGQLLLEGPSLAREYLNDPVKTAAAFVTDPAWVAQLGFTPGRRFYRTGDLVRQNNDGSLTYIGRRDAQIKIRGQRVEIGEVEHHICQYPATSQAAVVYTKEGVHAQKLVAFLSLHDYASSASRSSEVLTVDAEVRAAMSFHLEEIQRSLYERVMPYMVPTLWILVKALPLNASGKIDRRQLLQWLTTTDAAELDDLAPTGEVVEAMEISMTRLERELREVWSEVLNVPIAKVMLNRSFLSLGGDSITAMQVVSQCRGRHIILTVRDVLQCQSITQLTLHTKANTDSGADRAYDSFEPFTLSPVQELFFRVTAAHGLQTQGEDRFNQSVLVRVTRPVDIHALSRAVEVVVAKHAMLRARFHGNSEEGWRQTIDDKLIGSYRLRVLQIQREAELIDALTSAQTSLDLENGPVFSVHVLQQGEVQMLFLVAHHLVVDLVSWRIILHDLTEVLEKQLLSVPKGLSFQTWCRLQDEIPSWQLEPSRVLPYKVPSPEWAYWGLERGFCIEAHREQRKVWLDEHTTSLLLGSCHHAMRTEPIEIFLAALLHSFHHAFPDREVPAVFNEGHGRESWDDTIELSATVGWFTTITPLFVPNAGYDVIETLRRTKDRRRSVPGKGLPYFTSRFRTSSGREAFRDHDYPEILFNYQGRYQQLEREDSLFVLQTVDEDREMALPSAIGANTRAQAIFDVNASIVAGRACTVFRFGPETQYQSRIQQWLEGYEQSMCELIRRLMEMKPVATVSDFPLATVTAEELDSFEGIYLPQLGIVDLRDIEDIYPCSPVQQGILISQAKDPRTYQVRQVCEIRRRETSPVPSVEVLIEAWQRVVDRHSILRTAIVEVSSATDPYHQMVLKSWKAAVMVIECQDNEVAAQISTLARLERQDCRPGHRLTIIQTTTGRTQAILDIDHALCDASSIQLIVQDWVQAYDGRLPPGPGRLYSSYITYLQQESRAVDLEYWTRLLKHAQPSHVPPLSKHPATSKFHQQSVQMSTAQITDLAAFRALSQNRGVTVANIIQLAWGLVLASYTASNNVCFGYLINGRDAPVEGIHELVGPMIYMTVCYINIDRGMTVLEAIQRVRDRFLEGLDHQRTSLAAIQHALRLPEQGLFNTGISYRRGSGFAASRGEHIDLEAISADDGMDYDLALGIEATDDRLGFGLQWRTSFTDQAGAERLLRTVVSIAQRLVQNPDEKLRTISSLSAEDSAQIREWNATVPARLQCCIHDLVQARCESQPDAIAVSAWDGELTYRELWMQAQRLAHHLVNRSGVRPEIKVGLCMDKSQWAVVSMLAILLAGGVVVPLGTQHPRARLGVIVEDTAMSIIIVDQMQASRLAGLVPQVLLVDGSWLATLPVITASNSTVTPDNAAWIIYTSGSTGKPKGVVLEHAALCTSLQVQGQRFHMGPQTRTLQFSAFTFDVSIADIFATVIYGGCVCIIPESDRLNNLAGAMEMISANFVQLTPTVAQLLSPYTVPSLRVLVLGGEISKPDMIKIWAQHATVLIAYGPTECSIASSYSDPLVDEGPSIGLPLAGCFWVTDLTDYHRLSPIGVTGELLLEGPLLAREYLNDEAKTAAAFVTDPAWAVAQLGLAPGRRRFYRTGDLVRQNSDGSLTYIGRQDTQIKIRGQRVEIGEIENWISRLLPEVQSAAVDLVVREGTDGRGEQFLLAAAVDFKMDSRYLTGDNQPQSASIPLTPSSLLRETFQQLRASLSSVLPVYMVPNAYIPMNHLPLNSSGKLDRRIIHDILNKTATEYVQTVVSDGEEKCLPSSETERRLQTLWAEALGLEPDKIGMRDHFFQMGGDSISAMRLVAAGRGLSLALTVADIFQHPRIVDLARTIDHQDSGKSNNPVANAPPFSLWVPEAGAGAGPDKLLQSQLEVIADQCSVATAQIEDIYPCTPLQEGLMAISTQQAAAYMAQRIFRLGPEVDLDRFCASWTRVAELTAVLRTRIVPAGRQGCIQVVVRQPVSWIHSDSLSTYLAADHQTPVAYGSPLTRFALIQEPGQGEESTTQRFFVWTGHHSTYDGWSLRKIAELLRLVYQDDHIPPAVPFSRFVVYLKGVDPVRNEAFWRRQLEEVHAAQFPVLRQAQYRPHVAQKVTRYMARHSYRGHETVSTVLRAAWAMVVAQWTGVDDVIFAVTVSGRSAPVVDILDLVAPTIATVPVRIRVDREKTVHDFLSGVQDQATEMIAYEHTGLQNIRRIVPEAAASLNLGHLFLVQAPTEVEKGAMAGLPGVEVMEGSMEGFHSYPLIVECVLDDKWETVKVEARFDEIVISEPQVLRVLAQYEHVFQQLLAGKINRVQEVEVLSEEDRATIRTWNTTAPAPLRCCIHDMVRDRCKSQPDSIAICAWDGDLTYHALWTQSQRVAYYLVRHGVGPEVKVGLCMDKSRWTAISMLAILQAGGTVVPLGTQHPRARIEGIVDDTDMKIILVDSTQALRLAGLLLSLVTVSDSWLTTLSPTAVVAAPCTKITPDHAAWIIYTSGSTGTPKGVVLEHAALCSSLKAHGAKFGIDEHTRTLQFAAHTFDVCISEVFATIIYGGCVCIASDTDRLNNLAGAIESMAVNFAQLTSTVAQLLSPRTAPSLKSIVLMGEAVKPAVITIWGLHATVISAYGPSESSIHSSYSGSLVDPEDALSIGRPLAGCFWVTNPTNYNRLCPVGVGVVGELLLEGPLLARGYLNDPAKTAAVFVTDPEWVTQLGVTPGRRLYRTGDLVRQHYDGTLSYVGRYDTQVKIRGQRVEIGEIENWVGRLLPEVQMVAASLISRESSRGEQILLAVAVDFKPNSRYLAQGDQLASELLPSSNLLREAFHQLRASLFNVLPAYMVPNVYIPMSRLPLNASGKLDRRKVHEILASQDPQILLQFVSSQSNENELESPVAAQLRTLLADLLNIEEQLIGGNDNIFQLGSDSITAMKLVTLARAQNISLSVADIFRSSTISGMATLAKMTEMPRPQELREYRPFSLLDVLAVPTYIEEQMCPLVNAPSDDIVDVLPVTDVQAYSIVTSLMKNQMELRYFKWVANGPVDVAYLKACCARLVDRLEPLRTVYVFSHGTLLQVVLRTYDQEIATYKVQGPIEPFAEKLMQAGMHRPPKLGQPLFDVAIISQKDSLKHWILFRITHAAYDGISLPMIWSTLQSIYTEQPKQSYPSFPSFMADQAQRTTEETYDYWRKLLDGSSMPQIGQFLDPVLQIPFMLAKVAPPPSIRIRTLHGEGLTPAIYIKSAWTVVLAKCTGRDDVVFGDTVSNRDYSDAQVAGALGCCINIIPFRVRLQPSWKNVDLLRCVRDQQLASAPNSCLGFRGIFKDCTDWPAGTRYTSSLNHLNSPPRASTIGGHEYQISPAGLENFGLSDLALTSIQYSDLVTLELGYGKDRVEPEVATHILSLLQSVIEAMMDFPGAPVVDLPQLPPSFDVPLLARTMRKPERVVETQEAGRPIEPSARIVRAWNATLGQKLGPYPVGNGPPPSLFKLGGDMVDAAALANHLQHEGSDVTIEDILESSDLEVVAQGL
ncbi:acetyl-CoA synthetase-like protein [Lindgomyces ingoldianus]|uniref:Acetyl-CoA synthetase-like protein n=1 Tax=Lindgomyces ingoldianus TaxID=673940 RepID=A0ACB6QP91_9PLEO|nr:acetyl-CoA synthetase-like protein [Lindgomyces ingoldianus]KAF2468736.1 acetyl-CoA synthetase-like protein [Lindgomyces ingoldianus]